MPYYFGEEMPGWPEYLETRHKEFLAGKKASGPPDSAFQYIEPWEAKTTVLPFPETPGPEPELPQRTGENWFQRYKAECAHALWKVSKLAATCQALGVKRVFGCYDGGGDEGFAYFHGAVTSDGRVITEEALSREVRGRDDCDELALVEVVGNAVSALMGTFDAGPFVLHGMVMIDFDACTITDEKNANVVLGDKQPWEV
jgi:hypothetical protein